MARGKVKSERVEVRLTPAQRRSLEALAAAKRTTLTGAFGALLDKVTSNGSSMASLDGMRDSSPSGGNSQSGAGVRKDLASAAL